MICLMHICQELSHNIENDSKAICVVTIACTQPLLYSMCAVSVQQCSNTVIPTRNFRGNQYFNAMIGSAWALL